MKHIFPVIVLSCFVLGLTAESNRAEACPMCKSANESADDPRPRAYMYSILFMLAMPATVLTGFGISFYRLSQKQQLLNDAATNGESESTTAESQAD